MPGYFAGPSLFPFGHAGIACIAKDMRLCAMQQRMGLRHIIDIGCGGHNGMGQAGIGIPPIWAFMPKYHSLPFFV